MDEVHNPVLEVVVFPSMLKNHLDKVSCATSMPPICDEWFLTCSKNGSAETLSFAAPDVYVQLVKSGATLQSYDVHRSSLAKIGKGFIRALKTKDLYTFIYKIYMKYFKIPIRYI